MKGRDGATRAETVGSLLRPETVFRTRRDFAEGAVGREELERVLDSAVLEAIRVQERARLDVVSDGEMRRLAWAQTPHFLDCFEAVDDGDVPLNWRGGEGGPPPGTPPAYPKVVRPISTAERVASMADEYAFLARHAGTRTKYSLAAPSYHRRYWSDRHSAGAYASCTEFLYEVRDYQREVLAELVALGCDYVQLDAPNYGSLCDPDTRMRMQGEGHDLDAELEFDAELDNSLFDGFDDVTRGLHICRGNGPGGRWHSAGGYGAISAQLFPRLDFDVLLLEYDSDRAGAFGPLADVRSGTTAVLGLLTTKDGRLEDENVLDERIDEAARVKPLRELALSTQCGFASVAGGNPLSEAEQLAKLQLVAKLAHRKWKDSAS